MKFHHILFINQFFDTMSTYTYISKTLNTKISMADAKYLKRLFEPKFLEKGAWVSMQNVVSIPEELRRKTIMETAKKLLDEQGD